MSLLDGLFYDLRLSLRTLCRDKGFSLAAIAMLALAIGLNVTVFAIMNTMLFRGFPLVQRNDALVYVKSVFPRGDFLSPIRILKTGALRRMPLKAWRSWPIDKAASARQRAAPSMRWQVLSVPTPSDCCACRPCWGGTLLRRTKFPEHLVLSSSVTASGRAGWASVPTLSV